jgi:hypothetical protein
MQQVSHKRRAVRVPALLAAALLTLLLAVAASASAETLTGTVSDPSGDQAGGRNSEYDLLSFTASYDSAGTIFTQVRLAAEPSPSMDFLKVLFGTTQPDGTCIFSYALSGLIGRPDTAFTGTIARFTELGQAIMGGTGTTVTLSGGASALADRGIDCAGASTNYSDIVDLAGPMTLRAPAPPPTQTTTETTPPPPTTTTPQPSGPPSRPNAPPTRPQPPAAAHLQLSLSAVAPLPRGRWTTLRAGVRNAGGRPARSTTLRLTLPRGVEARPLTRSLGTLNAGASTVVRIRARLTATARATSLVRAAVGARGVASARRSIALHVRRRVAALRVSVRGVTPIARGSGLRVPRATVANSGVVAAHDVTLHVAGRGVGSAPTRTRIGTIAPKDRRTVTVRVKLGASVRTPATVRFTVTGAKHLAAHGTAALQTPAPKREAGSGDPMTGGSYARPVASRVVAVRQAAVGRVVSGVRTGGLAVQFRIPPAGIPRWSQPGPVKTYASKLGSVMPVTPGSK